MPAGRARIQLKAGAGPCNPRRRARRLPAIPFSGVAVTSEVLTFSGPPIRQPVAMGGPMVMNTRAVIDQAFRDFHTGRFGTVPRQARLQHR
ncbi:pirin-like C-terminal cupin domain-containing protein [Streptomyces doebereineriae]|uniref:Pirin-like C-terminal cupin domain-containing protein n=1 Tax=Streptomyces doebereineriae TaxID=3075528 RepID=A0ABU2V1D7_9ACTN|nr:pirin-like C-terminal cupin domain-containing protein [Streptomyces sp. DSM 41640]MDT0479355.1 pirin-like C-terminal cupin domain-containing protein [Streptomyces sp. DSM 41640]